MTPLAALHDVEARLGQPIGSGEAERAEALLVDASARVRAWTGQTFNLVEDDEVVLRPVGTLLRLPQRPVVAVRQVVAIGPGGLPDIPLSGWSWDGADLVDVAGWQTVAVNLPAWVDDIDTPVRSYRVRYDHGWGEVPDDVVSVVCAMVIRTLMSPSMIEGLVSERIGAYSYQLQQGSGAVGGSVRMTRDDREVLARYRRSATTIAVGVH